MGSEFLDTKQLARTLGVTRQTIRRWRLAGVLPKPVRRVGSTKCYWLSVDIVMFQSPKEEQKGTPKENIRAGKPRGK
jgi:DNA-binding transcriptional MerR regulator